MGRRPGHAQALMPAGLAILLLLLGSFLPLWTMTLHAPQYPNGLRLIIDGQGTGGDVEELNALNHYIGMPAIRDEQFPEQRLFTPGVVLLTLGLIISALLPRRALRWLVAIGSWALPVGFLADLQWRLYQFGHSLNPEAAFRLPAFTPRVLGPTVVMNFNVTAMPGAGLILFMLSALVFAIGPRIPLLNTGRRRGMAAAAVAGTGLIACVLAVPSLAAVAPAISPPFSPAGRAVAFDLARAIAAAPDGAVIDVPPGRYAGPLVLSRPVTLRGAGRAVIDGRGQGSVVVITGNDVRLEGFTIRGSALAFSSEAAGVVVRGARAAVRDNRIEEVLFGIYLAGASDALVEQNTITTADLAVERRGHAIYLWKAARSRVVGNSILRGKDGIYISFSDDNLVERNSVSACRYGIHYMYSSRSTFRSNVFRGNIVGAAVMYSSDVTLVGNTFEGSRSAAAGAGLIVKDADRLQVRENRITRNRVGLEFDNTPATIGGWARVERNLIAFNDVGFGLMSTTGITAIENTIVENLRPVVPRGAVQTDANRWSVGGRGNHWGDYTGFDVGSDGVGDVPYRRADALEELSARVPVLQAFLFTPAHQALTAASRLVPLLQTLPAVEDRAPLMSPPLYGRHLAMDRLAAGGSSAPRDTPSTRERGLPLMWTGLGLLLPAVAVTTSLRRRRR